MPSDFPLPSFLRSLPLARAALEYAAALHRDQRRESDAAPFILHPLEVASLLHNTGHGEHVVAAGILHDTIESSGAAAEDIAARFGPEVAQLVEVLTEDPAIASFTERKAALRRQVAEFDSDAAAVYAADKVTKVRELRARLVHDPALLDSDAAAGKHEHYRESLHMLEGLRREHPLVRQLRFELEALRALPPGASGRR